MNKGEGKRKQKGRKKQAPRTREVSPSVSKEIVGIALIGISILVLIGIFSSNAGLFGELLKGLFVGLFGIGGYIFPLMAIGTGIFYMQGRKDFVYRMLVYGSTLVVLLISFFHLLCFGEDTSISLMSMTYLNEASWQTGGYVGAMLAYLLLKLIGLYGSYVLLAVCYVIWLLLVTQFPVFTWLQGKIKLVMQAWHEQYQYKRQMNASQKRVKEKPIKGHLKGHRPMPEVSQVPDEVLLAGFDEVEESVAEEFDDEISSITETTAQVAPTIPFFDGSQYEESTSVEVPEVIRETPAPTPVDPIGHKLTHDEMVNSQPQIDLGAAQQVPEYHFPPVTLLKKVASQQDKEASKKSISNARKLEETLASFGVEAKVTQIHRGPSVTRYELQPKQGVKVSKIVNLSDDIALNLAAPNIRIEAPIPGKAAVGIEVANSTSEIVYLRDVIDSDRFLAFPSKLAFALGKDIAGKPIIADIGKMPHMLIAGATGSGKSVCINTLITSILYKATPQEVRLIMIDPKVVELSVYNGIPHLLIPVVTDPKKAAGALFWAVNEMTRRYNLFAENNVRDMKGYNEKQIDETARLPQIVIIIDELADLMMTGAKEVEDAICRLAQMARAAGIHLVIATQRPSVDVITGVIKANIPSRLAFAVSSGTDSRTILDMVGAEKLLGKGDMLFYPVGESKPIRIQGAFISDAEVESIVSTIRTEQVVYEQSMMESLERAAIPSEAADEAADELLEKAVAFAADKEKLSISMLQRYFRIGFNRAARLMEALEARGIVGPDEGSKPRKVL